MISTVLGLTTFIANNPGMVAWMLGGLISSIVGLIIGYYYVVNKKLDNLEASHKVLDADIRRIDKDLESYKEHVGAGDKELKAMNDRVKEHMDREEREVWVGMKDLKDMLVAMQLENTTAHAAITTNQAVMETRVVALEKKMPNGQLDRLVELLEKQVVRRVKK